jgi:uncharacterized membrane protein YeaQ/YmgE (transglycosylase-associated protein family)
LPACGTFARAATLTPAAKGNRTMGFIVYLFVGGIVGWLASLIMKTDKSQGIFLNVVVGIVGACLAGLLLTPLFGVAPIASGASLSLPAIAISLLGAVILLALINLIRRGSLTDSPG